MDVAIRSSGASTALLNAFCVESVGKQRRFILGALRNLRRLAVRLGDPSVDFELHGSRIILPLSHNLPVYRSVFPRYSENFREIVQAIELVYGHATVIDIGANVGDSVALAGPEGERRYLCIEGDTEYLPFLRHNVRAWPNVTIEPSYLVSADIDLAGATVSREGGTAHLRAEVRDDNARVVSKSLIDVLQRHPEFRTSNLLKVDTDGLDVGILRAASEWILDGQPPIFMEYDPNLLRRVGSSDAFSFFGELVDWGYREAVVYSNFGELIGRYDLDDACLLEMAKDLGSDGHPIYWDLLLVAAKDQAVATEVVKSARTGA